MVVGQSNIKSRSVVPPKYDPPLVIHSDAPETRQTAAQLFKVIRRRGTEVIDISSYIQQIELS
jgi:hypothetical protein